MKGNTWLWVAGGVVLLILIVKSRGSGITTVGDNSAAANALEAQRLQSGQGAFTALASAYGMQAQAQAQRDSNIAVARAQSDAVTANAKAQAAAANRQAQSNDLGSVIYGIISLFGLL